MPSNKKKKIIMNIFQKTIVKIVKSYQRYLSPDHSDWAKEANRHPYCKYYPSCSQYMIDAVEKKWAFFWTLKWIWRILRCMPWSKGGYDPVEK